MKVHPGREPFNPRSAPEARVETAEHVEGRTRLVVPRVSLTTDPPPTAPVFFNPAASLNRDVTVAVTAALGASTFCDSMAGSGARGLRVAHELTRVETVALVDFNREALALARRSAGLNRVLRKCEFAEAETSSYLYSRYGRDQRFDCVDLDPFGTPVRQLQGGLNATADGGILSVTATDTAVLCGVHRDVCRRRYGASPLNNKFHHETAIRVLLGAVARTGAALDIGATPVAAHSTRHYVRVYCRIRVGATGAAGTLKHLGYVVWCPSCGGASTSPAEERGCAACGKKAKSAGPLWVDGLADSDLVAKAVKEAGEAGLAKAEGVLRPLEEIDRFPPWSFDIEEVCSELGIPSVPEAQVRNALKRAGAASMRTPFEKRGVKTTASRKEFVGAVRDAAAAKT